MFQSFIVEVNTNKLEDLYTTLYKKTPEWVQSKLDYLKINVYLHKLADKFQDRVDKIEAKFSDKDSHTSEVVSTNESED